MYIRVSDLGIILLVLLVACALIYFIYTLRKVCKLIDNANVLLEVNKDNLNNTLSNVKEITDNVKDISDVATDVTAEAIVAKESITNNIQTIKDIINIVIGIFTK